MNGRISFTLAIIAIILGMLLAAFTLFKTGHDFSSGLQNQSSTWDLEHSEANRGSFSLGKVRYVSNDDIELNGGVVSCNSSKSANIVLDLYVKSAQVPEICSVYLDRKLIKELKMEPYSCGFNCASDEETVISISSKSVSLQNAHTVEVCCDSYCAKNTLPAECS